MKEYFLNSFHYFWFTISTCVYELFSVLEKVLASFKASLLSFLFAQKKTKQFKVEFIVIKVFVQV